MPDPAPETRSGFCRKAAAVSASVALLLLSAASMEGLRPGSALYPWDGVGGCGAGGSGGAGGGAAKWIGRGVSGGLLNLQSMASVTFGQDYQYFTFHNRFSGKPTWNTDAGLSVPLLSKLGNVQYRSNQQDKTYATGGLGDLSLDAAYTFGSSGQYSLTLSSTLPTGQYDIKRGPDGGKNVLPLNLQKGQGVYSPSLMFSWSRDSDRGMFMADLSYTHPVAMRLFSGKNEFLDGSEYGFDAVADKSDSRFYYRFKPYGENDLGDYFPPSVTLALYYAYRGHEKRVQSAGVAFNAPLGTAWIHSERAGQYDPRPDPDFKAWTATLHYGYEFSNEDFPFYFALNLPVYDKKNPVDPDNEYDEDAVSKWDGPDLDNLFETVSVYFGFKSTFF